MNHGIYKISSSLGLNSPQRDDIMADHIFDRLLPHGKKEMRFQRHHTLPPLKGEIEEGMREIEGIYDEKKKNRFR